MSKDYSNLISVIIPVYNVAPYLERCLDSVLNSTDKHFEVICINDGSTDGSGAILDQYAAKDERITVLHQENQGVSHARNMGLRSARGQWITFIDSDDYIHSQMLEAARAFFDDFDIVVTGYRHVQESDHREAEIDLLRVSKETIDSTRAVEVLQSRYFVWGKFYKYKLIENHFFDESLSFGEDYLFNLGVFGEKRYKVLHIMEPLYYYCVRSGSASRVGRLYKQMVFCDLLVDYAYHTDKKQLRRLYSLSAVKRALTCRYDIIFEGFTKSRRASAGRKCNEILEKGLSHLYMSRDNLREYIKYRMLYRFPAVYILGRILQDPKWEYTRWSSLKKVKKSRADDTQN